MRMLLALEYMRGGSWVNPQNVVRAPYRYFSDLSGPNYSDYNIGFRVVVSSRIP